MVTNEKPKPIIKFRNFMAPAGVEPEAVASALAKVATEEGMLKPEAVVNAARDAANPLHPCFTWDDSKAAEKQRLHEARLLIKCVRIECQETHRSEPVYMSVRTDTAKGYMLATEITTADEWTGAISRAREAVARAAACIEDLRRVAKRANKDASEVIAEMLKGLL
jgi:hypothetical protein